MKQLRWLIIPILLFLIGCAAIPKIPFVSAKPGSQTSRFRKEQREEIPRAWEDSKGKIVVAKEVRYSRGSGSQKVMAKLTWGERGEK